MSGPLPEAKPEQDPAAGLTIGSFRLKRPLARGGMGTVWLAHHHSGAPAALKIIAADRAEGPVVISAMQAEIRSVGALDHPNIVRVYDAGTLEQHHEASSRRTLRAGSPWLAMELASGLISDLADNFDWSMISTALLQVLDGLAHAHARGIIHRDLKPANILYIKSTDVRAVLADFGLAWQLRGSGPLHGGSLPYAAPEQILGKQAEQGPGTDLYSLGCSVYRLVCGARPFQERDPEALCRAHLNSPIPKVTPLFPVSPELDDWLAGLLAKDPRDRFQCAADAAWALQRLAPASPSPPSASEDDNTDPDPLSTSISRSRGSMSRGAVRSHSRSTSNSQAPVDADAITASFLPTLDLPGTKKSQHRPAYVRPPFPDDWARPRDARPPVGRGLGVFGLRMPTMVGRAAERDMLWGMLKTLEAPQIVMLRGGAGIGKSRLAAWFTERAQEVGAAEVFRTSFRKADTDSDDGEELYGERLTGIAQMFEEHLRTEGLDLETLSEHLENRLSSLISSKRLASMLRPQMAEGPPVALTERVSLARKLIEQRNTPRRTIIWLDDVQFDGVEPLALVEALTAIDQAILFIVTARDIPPNIDAKWHTLVQRLDGIDVTLDPMNKIDLTSLISRMLPIEAVNAAKIAALANGSPLAVVEIVSDLVERGALRGDPGGVRLESPDSLAASVAERWATALERLDEELADARLALQVAAVLGHSFSHSEWRDVMRKLGIAASPTLLTLLTNRAFLVPTHGDADNGGRSTFAHTSLREILVASARSGEPFIDLACAEILSARGIPFAARAAAHWEAAGELAQAAECYLSAIRWLATWDTERAYDLAGRWVTVLAGVPISDEQRIWRRQGLELLVSVQAVRSSTSRGAAFRLLLEDLLAHGRSVTERTGDTRAETLVLLEITKMELSTLWLDGAIEYAELAVQSAERTPLATYAMIQLIECWRVKGHTNTAQHQLQLLLPSLEGDDYYRALIVMCKLHTDTTSRLELARTRLVEALESDVQGFLRAELQHQLGNILVAKGHAAEAVVLFEEAWTIYSDTGLSSPDPEFEVDYGEALLEVQQIRRAHTLFTSLAGVLDPDSHTALFVHVHAALASIAASAAARDAADRVARHLDSLTNLALAGHRPAALVHLHTVERWARAHKLEALALDVLEWLEVAESADRAGREDLIEVGAEEFSG